MLKSRSLKFQRFRQRNNNNRSRSRNNVLLALYSHRNRSSSAIDDFKENSEEEIRTVLKSVVSKNHGRDRRRHELGPQLINNISSSSGSVGNNNYQYVSTANASMRYIDRSFLLLERVMKPSVFLVLLTSFVGVVFCVFFAALYVFKEVVTACRNVVVACAAVVRSADAIERACASVTTTTANLDQTTKGIDSTLGGIDVSLMSLSKALADAGVIQKNIKDLPKSASNTLLDAISAVSVPVNQKSVLPSKAESLIASNSSVGGDSNTSRTTTTTTDLNSTKKNNTNASILGEMIEGRRIAAGWVGSDSNYRFHFSATNKFFVGEYVAVKRTNNQYTWGVVENNETASDCEPDFNCPVDADLKISQSSGATCDWPPTKEQATATAKVLGQNDFKEDDLNFFERVKKFALPTGLAPGQREKEYRVVVEVSATIYRYKIVPASELGKRY